MVDQARIKDSCAPSMQHIKGTSLAELPLLEHFSYLDIQILWLVKHVIENEL